MFIQIYDDEFEFIIMKRTFKPVLEYSVNKTMYIERSKIRRSKFSDTVIVVT